jgi:hypothetical protein
MSSKIFEKQKKGPTIQLHVKYYVSDINILIYISGLSMYCAIFGGLTASFGGAKPP